MERPPNVTARWMLAGCLVCVSAAMPALVRAQTLREVAVVRASDAAPGDMFGEMVALSADGDTLAVNAPGRTLSGMDAAGAVYVFARRGRRFRQQATLVSPAPATSAQFGLSMALSADGDTLAAMNGLVDPRVHVFRRTSGGRAFELDLVRGVRSFGMSPDGRCVAASLTRGEVAVFRRGVAGWSADSVLPFVDARSITIADGCDAITLSVYAAVLVYERSADGWAVAPRGVLRTGSPLPEDRLGAGIAFVQAGDTIVLAGPRGVPCGARHPEGGSYTVYERTDARGWSLVANVEFDEATCPSALALTRDGSRLVAGHGWAQLGPTWNPAGAFHVLETAGPSRFASLAWERGARHPSRLGSGLAMTADGATIAAGSPHEGPHGGHGLPRGGPGAVHIYRAR